MGKIQMIESGLPMDGTYFKVGVDGVTKIMNDSQEYDDHTDYQFAIFKGDRIAAEWINVPVKITYFQEDDPRD